MQYKNIIRILGLLVALLSVTMLPPALVSLIYRDGGGGTIFNGGFYGVYSLVF